MPEAGARTSDSQTRAKSVCYSTFGRGSSQAVGYVLCSRARAPRMRGEPRAAAPPPLLGESSSSSFGSVRLGLGRPHLPCPPPPEGPLAPLQVLSERGSVKSSSFDAASPPPPIRSASSEGLPEGGKPRTPSEEKASPQLHRRDDDGRDDATMVLMVPKHRQEVVDVIGAADALVGGFVAARCRRLPPAQALLWATAAGTLSTMGRGSVNAMPTVSQLADYLHKELPELAPLLLSSWEAAGGGAASCDILGEPELRAAFDRCDRNESGTIDYGELRRALKDVKLHLDTGEAKELLVKYDADGSGEMEFNEFKGLCAALAALNLNLDTKPTADADADPAAVAAAHAAAASQHAAAAVAAAAASNGQLEAANFLGQNELHHAAMGAQLPVLAALLARSAIEGATAAEPQLARVLRGLRRVSLRAARDEPPTPPRLGVARQPSLSAARWQQLRLAAGERQTRLEVLLAQKDAFGLTPVQRAFECYLLKPTPTFLSFVRMLLAARLLFAATGAMPPLARQMPSKPSTLSSGKLPVGRTSSLSSGGASARSLVQGTSFVLPSRNTSSRRGSCDSEFTDDASASAADPPGRLVSAAAHIAAVEEPRAQPKQPWRPELVSVESGASDEIAAQLPTPSRLPKVRRPPPPPPPRPTHPAPPSPPPADVDLHRCALCPRALLADAAIRHEARGPRPCGCPPALGHGRGFGPARRARVGVAAAVADHRAHAALAQLGGRHPWRRAVALWRASARGKPRGRRSRRARAPQRARCAAAPRRGRRRSWRGGGTGGGGGGRRAIRAAGGEPRVRAGAALLPPRARRRRRHRR